eukprot:CAMPEP_0119341122 /NCGR_PEP_ID=MMETSP1333-20130426/101693_1 /TAXON_ID=418940 /ORGANISM="Scyphosphaera apsteinii, Strain RCC1455" /LENGTH=219 /DNA_ID=CAMNT_0007353019 /DNA_START=125 /DNA_END=781 /DNA_ORIENTATION=+
MYRPAAAVAVVRIINQACVRAYSDKVIKLSDTLQPLPRSLVCNVHGVRAEFLTVGSRATLQILPFDRFGKGAYFIGKVLWAKGYRHLIDHLSQQPALGMPRTRVDVYGDGEDLEQVQAAAAHLDIHFCGPCDHAHPKLHGYRVFVNPSRTEVLSTTTAEALAMGKWVVVLRHPSNAFFEQFANTLLYNTPAEFLEALQFALSHPPAPLTPEEKRRLSWE